MDREKNLKKKLWKCVKVFIFLLYLQRLTNGDMSYKSVKYVIDLLNKNGFVFKSQKGSHMKYEKNGKIVVVPNHGSKGIERGTYYSILGQAGIEE